MVEISSFNEGFDGSSLNGAVWQEDTVNYTMGGGLIDFGHVGVTDVYTQSSYDASIGGIEVKFNLFSDSNDNFILGYRNSAGNEFYFWFSDFDGAVWIGYSDTDGATLGEVFDIEVPFDPSTYDLWIRFRTNLSDVLSYETSPDGETWSVAHTVSSVSSIGLGSAVVFMYATPSSPDTGDTFIVDHIKGIDESGAYVAPPEGILSLPSAGTMFPLTSI